MSFSAQKATPFEVSSEALNKIIDLKINEGAKFFRVYVTGGGCSGFQSVLSLMNTMKMKIQN